MESEKGKKNLEQRLTLFPYPDPGPASHWQKSLVVKAKGVMERPNPLPPFRMQL